MILKHSKIRNPSDWHRFTMCAFISFLCSASYFKILSKFIYLTFPPRSVDKSQAFGE